MKSKTLGLDLLYRQFVDLAINKENKIADIATSSFEIQISDLKCGTQKLVAWMRKQVGLHII